MTKILLVETFTMLRQDLAEVLSLEGYTVVQAESGWVGLQLAWKHLPDLILTAVQLSGINGFELYARLRATPALSSIPIIFITTGMLPPPAGVVLTPDNFLRKPFGIKALLDLIRRRLDAAAPPEDTTIAAS